MFLELFLLYYTDLDFCPGTGSPNGWTRVDQGCYNKKFSSYDKVKKFLTPVTSVNKKASTATPILRNETEMAMTDKFFITGVSNSFYVCPGWNSGQVGRGYKCNYYRPFVWFDYKYFSYNNGKGFIDLQANSDHYKGNKAFRFQIFDVSQSCSTWAQAATSAMSITMFRWSRDTNISLQYIIDCDDLGDYCIHRSGPMSYLPFLKYNPVKNNDWRSLNYSEPPVKEFNNENCNTCYPTSQSCTHHVLLSGSCDENSDFENCPIYSLTNWRHIKYFLFEVGAVTSTIMVYPSLFTYRSGIYSKLNNETEPIGMMDVTIIGYGQSKLNLAFQESTNSNDRYWIVIPHLGCDFGMSIDEIFKYQKCNENVQVLDGTDKVNVKGTEANGIFCYQFAETSVIRGSLSQCKEDKGYMMIRRRFNELQIESNAYGAVPLNYIPDAKNWV